MTRMRFSVLGFSPVAAPAPAEGLLTPMGPIAADQQTPMIRATAITMLAVLPVSSE